MQGVYAQLNIPEDSEPYYDYIQAVDCVSLYGDEIPESIKESLKGYMCPDVREVRI